MTKVEKHADYIIDHTDMAVMAYLEKGSDYLTVCVSSDYSEFIGAVAYLIWHLHAESKTPLKKIGEDLNDAVKILSEMEGE